MGLFSKKQTYEWVSIKEYYKINGEIYQLTLDQQISTKDKELSNIDLFNKYGVEVCKYDLTYDCFADWDQYYVDTFDQVIAQLGDADEIDVKDLAKTIKTYKVEFKKKFEDFDLDDEKLYTRTSREGAIGEQCFNTIVKPISKLVNEKNKGMTSLILEIEVLNGKSAETRREFMTFIKFVENYAEGCNLKIFETIDDINNVDDYFVGKNSLLL